jgi:carbon monoxide dehydrogenase subunit G
VPKIDNEIVIDRSPEEVWAVLGDLAAVKQWVPGVKNVRMEGMRRICTMEDGAEIHEQISDLDGHSFRYEQTVHPLGFRRSEGALAVAPHGEGARVAWDAEIEFADREQEAQFVPMLEHGYAEALQRLKETVEK